MSTYIVYSFNFEPKQISEKLYEQLPDETTRMEKKQDYLSEILNDQNFTFRKNRNESYHFKRLSQTGNGIFCLKLANKRHVKLENNFNVIMADNSPSCNVIIDNRIGEHHILIESDATAFSDTNVVRNIIRSTLNHYLSVYGLTLDINKEFRPTEFWDFTKEYPEINMLRFNLLYADHSSAEENAEDFIQQQSRILNSTNTTVEFRTQANAILNISPDDQELKKLVEISARSGNRITCKLKGQRRFLSIGNAPVTCELNEDDLTNDDSMFETHQEHLARLLDSINL